MRAEWHRPRVPTEDAAYRDYKRVLEFKIGDVRDYDSVSAAVRDAQFVFHAAALKQVPSCEYEPIDGGKTNDGTSLSAAPWNTNCAWRTAAAKIGRGHC